MLILIDRDELKMVAAAGSRKWINLVGYVDFPGKKLVVADSLEGKTWTVLDAEEMATLFKNMSGQDAPPYATAIEQLRSYADTWPNYPKSEAQLEKEAEQIFQQEQIEAAEEGGNDPYLAGIAARGEVSRETHQACIDAAEAANAKLTPEDRAQAAASAPTSAPKAKKEPSGEAAERPRQGVTKRIWEIADELLAVTGSIGNIKEFRKSVIDRAQAEGANGGTAATQFGKWKSSKGL
jgi:hypothetical protein